jgi:hypothetical protein
MESLSPGDTWPGHLALEIGGVSSRGPGTGRVWMRLMHKLARFDFDVFVK